MDKVRIVKVSEYNEKTTNKDIKKLQKKGYVFKMFGPHASMVFEKPAISNAVSNDIEWLNEYITELEAELGDRVDDARLSDKAANEAIKELLSADSAAEELSIQVAKLETSLIEADAMLKDKVKQYDALTLIALDSKTVWTVKDIISWMKTQSQWDITDIEGIFRLTTDQALGVVHMYHKDVSHEKT